MKTITVEQLKERIESGEKLNLIDVREPHEHSDFNIGGLLIPLGKIQSMQIEDIDELRNKEVICYCRSGNRSMQAAMILEQIGFTDTVNVVGGMLDWTAKFPK